MRVKQVLFHIRRIRPATPIPRNSSAACSGSRSTAAAGAAQAAKPDLGSPRARSAPNDATWAPRQARASGLPDPLTILSGGAITTARGRQVLEIGETREAEPVRSCMMVWTETWD